MIAARCFDVRMLADSSYLHAQTTKSTLPTTGTLKHSPNAHIVALQQRHERFGHQFRACLQMPFELSLLLFDGSELNQDEDFQRMLWTKAVTTLANEKVLGKLKIFNGSRTFPLAEHVPTQPHEDFQCVVRRMASSFVKFVPPPGEPVTSD